VRGRAGSAERHLHRDGVDALDVACQGFVKWAFSRQHLRNIRARPLDCVCQLPVESTEAAVNYLAQSFSASVLGVFHREIKPV